MRVYKQLQYFKFVFLRVHREKRIERGSDLVRLARSLENRPLLIADDLAVSKAIAKIYFETETRNSEIWLRVKW